MRNLHDCPISMALSHYGKYGTGRPIGCATTGIICCEPLPDFVKALNHGFSRLAVGDNAAQLGANPLRREIRLHQFGDDIPLCDQIHHRKAIHLY